MRLRDVNRWIAIVRLIAVPFAVFQVLVSTYPPGYRAWALGATITLAVGAGLLYVLSRRDLEGRPARFEDLLALTFDWSIVSAFVLIYHFELGTPTRQLLYLPLIEAAVRFGLTGSVVAALASTPVVAVFEGLRSGRTGGPYRWNFVTFQLGVELLMALIAGWLVRRLAAQTAQAQARAEEAEGLRDELGRRADLLDAANRCARALSSSLELSEAFGAFIRELRGLVPFSRMAIVLAEDNGARVIATAGEAAETVMPPGELLPLDRNLLADVVARGQTIYRRDMSDERYAEERTLLDVGVRSRVAAPLLAGARAIGIISVGRADADAFTAHEVELVSLLGRLVASAVQNIRSYDAERHTVEELRRLSALRADFVSLVSHELRSPMAAVIGSARTLQGRWRELAPEQRDAFLALIADETDRLATLIGDVLDTSRIDAGTFSYSFSDVDVGEVVEEAASTARVGQDAVPIETRVAPGLPTVRGDRARLRQVLSNLIDNAVKYSPEGVAVEVRATASNGTLLVDVTDRGAGIPPEHQRVIFEKFGRVGGVRAKPGTGLGLYIARSITEAHGGTLDVSSSAGRGTTFTLRLPVE